MTPLTTWRIVSELGALTRPKAPRRRSPSLSSVPGGAAAAHCLQDGNPVKLVEFLQSGQFTARTADERVEATQLISSGGPETRAAARIALESPPHVLHQFIAVGQYQAKRRDQLAATHIADVQYLIAGAASVAAGAQKNAAEAARVAAVARKAAAEAKSWAEKARESADEAKKYADDAARSARDAETSANQARESAKTARAAEADANEAASRAVASSVSAQSSAAWARGSADEAAGAAAEARVSAIAAGKDADAADKAFKEARKSWIAKQRAEAEARRKELEERRKEAAKQKADHHVNCTGTGLTTICRWSDEKPEEPPSAKPFDEMFLGLFRSVPYLAGLGYTSFNTDCWGDNQAAGGCDLGAQYDNWVMEQGYDTAGDPYLVPGALAAIFGAGPRPGGPHGAKPRPRLPVGGIAARGTMDPKAIRYTQDSIKATFQEGGSIHQLANDIKSKKVDPASIPPIRIFTENKKTYSLDNRRLWIFKKLDLPVNFVKATPREVERERSGPTARKVTEIGDGMEIFVREGRG